MREHPPNIAGFADRLHTSMNQLPLAEFAVSEAALLAARRAINDAMDNISGGLGDVYVCLDDAAQYFEEAKANLYDSRDSIAQYLAAIGVPRSGQPIRQKGAAAIIPPPPRELASPDASFQDRLLMNGFIQAVSSLDIAGIAVLQEGRKRPRSLDEFRLVPLSGPGRCQASTEHAGYKAALPPGVRSTYASSNGMPYIDTAIAIGLVRGDWLVAVSSAFLDEDNRLKIIQIQDVTGSAGKSTPENPKGKYKTGLHDGFLWRDTLVNAWEAVATQTGASSQVTIQGSENSVWDNLNSRPDHPGYDGVARRMGFTRNDADDWTKQI